MYREAITQWGTASTPRLRQAFHLGRQGSILTDGRGKYRHYSLIYHYLWPSIQQCSESFTDAKLNGSFWARHILCQMIDGQKLPLVFYGALMCFFYSLIADKQHDWSTAATAKWRSAYFSGLAGENLNWPDWSPQAALCISVKSSDEWHTIAFGRPH